MLSVNVVFSEFTANSSTYLAEVGIIFSRGTKGAPLVVAVRTQKYLMTIKCITNFNNKILHY